LESEVAGELPPTGAELELRSFFPPPATGRKISNRFFSIMFASRML
jgi:hypothetical protein